MVEAVNELVGLTAIQAAGLIRDSKLSALELTQACLEQIEAKESDVQAFAFLDPEHALGQARALDELRKHGRPLGPLHGLPVGVKDIIDTADMPTENGTVLHAGRRPRADATVVSRLRAAGAVILGKTVTTELAVYGPNKTHNPHHLRAHAGRLVVGLGGGGRGAHGAAGARHPDQRLGDPARGLLRGLRLQAEPWPDLARRHPAPVAAFGHGRRDGELAARSGPARRRADGLRPQGSSTPAGRSGAAARGRLRTAAGRARSRLRAQPGLGSGRGRDQGGLRRAGRDAWCADHGGRPAAGVRGRGSRCTARSWKPISRAASPPNISAGGTG